MKKLLFSFALLLISGILHAQSDISVKNSTNCSVDVYIVADDPGSPCNGVYMTSAITLASGAGVYYDLSGLYPAPWSGATPPPTASFVIIKVVSSGPGCSGGTAVGETCTPLPQTSSFSMPCSPTCSTINVNWSGSYGNPISVPIY